MSGCAVGDATEAPKEWEYRSETVTYSEDCLAEAIEPFSDDETIEVLVSSLKEIPVEEPLKSWLDSKLRETNSL